MYYVLVNVTLCLSLVRACRLSCYCYQPVRREPVTCRELEGIMMEKEDSGTLLDKAATVSRPLHSATHQ